MPTRSIPAKDKLTICFAHVAYQMAARFKLRNTGIEAFEVRSLDELERRIGEADVLLVSGMWRNEFIAKAPRLAFIQSISAGLDQYSRDGLRAAGIRLASAQGANERAVAEHAIALMLALARQLPQARDNQTAHKWRGMIGDITQREDELGGKTLAIIGMGRIGSRLATLAKAFDMRVIGIKRNAATGKGAADAVVAQSELRTILPEADFVALTCPLTPETEKLIDTDTLAAMRPSAYLINVARGRVVDEAALVAALEKGGIAGAAVDCVWEEPLPASSALWHARNIFITPHTAGETRRYEDNVLDLLIENLERLWRGDAELKNGVV
ncbi:MAG: hydroxyacid dehydrogenase [Betaproteobacteria bacterium]|nr:hydroxyacid dehydrogenase [Betaproteobacteria bacterium]